MGLILKLVQSLACYFSRLFLRPQFFYASEINKKRAKQKTIDSKIHIKDISQIEKFNKLAKKFKKTFIVTDDIIKINVINAT